STPKGAFDCAILKSAFSPSVILSRGAELRTPRLVPARGDDVLGSRHARLGLLHRHRLSLFRRACAGRRELTHRPLTGDLLSSPVSEPLFARNGSPDRAPPRRMPIAAARSRRVLSGFVATLM